MMKKKTFSIINICVVLLFAVYLVTALFIDFPKYVKIIILLVYLSYAVMRAIYYIKQLRDKGTVCVNPNEKLQRGQGDGSPVSSEE